MQRKAAIVLSLVLCVLFVHYPVEGQCVPTYREAAPETLDSSNCSGFLPTYRLYKTAHWALDWPGYAPFTNADPQGKGWCFGLKCWPLFDIPVTSEKQWKQRVVNLKMNCPDPASSSCNTCVYWNEKHFLSSHPVALVALRVQLRAAVHVVSQKLNAKDLIPKRHRL